MKQAFILFAQLLLMHYVYSQHTVGKRWDARFGGTASDEMYAIAQTGDGSFILAGSSGSVATKHSHHEVVMTTG